MPANDLDQLAALYDQLEAGGMSADRRRHPRTPVHGHLPATVQRPDKQPEAASVKDLSRSGVAIYFPCALTVGDQVVLRFHLAAKPIRANCRVSNCRHDQTTGRYVVGLEFVEVSRPASPITAPAPAEDLAASEQAQVGELTKRLGKLLAT
jgi:c-di-GMP-binding flagellar brake protein YcgR